MIPQRPSRRARLEPMPLPRRWPARTCVLFWIAFNLAIWAVAAWIGWIAWPAFMKVLS